MSKHRSKVKHETHQPPQPQPQGTSPREPGFFDRRGALIVWLLMGLYAAVFITLCAVKYAYYLYTDFDLPICAQATWGITHGQFYNSIRGMYWLGDHSWFTLFLVAPVYAVVTHAMTLLVLQTVVLALGALPVWWLARRELKNSYLAVCFAGLYLLYPALGYSNLYQFHPETMATTTLLFAFYYLRVGRFWPMLGFAVLSLMAKENVPLVVMMMGLYALVLRRPRRWVDAAALVGLSAVFLVVSFALLKPALNAGEADYTGMYRQWGATLGEAAVNVLRDPLRAVAGLFTTPEFPGDSVLKQQFYLHMFVPVLFLSLLSPATLAILLPVLAQHMLSARPSEHTIAYHYTKLMTPFVLAAAVVGLRNLLCLVRPESVKKGDGGLFLHLSAVTLSEEEMNAKTPVRTLGLVLATAAVLAAVVSNFLFGPVVGSGVMQSRGRDEAIWPSPHDRAMRPYMDAMADRVPAEGTVVASFQFLPREANRPSVHSWHHVFGGRYSVSSKTYEMPTDAVALIANLNDGRTQSFMGPESGRLARTFLETNKLLPVEAVGDVVLFLRETDEPVELYSTGRFTAANPRRVTYEGELAFLGSDAVPASTTVGGRLPLRTYWTRLGTVRRLFFTQFCLLDEFDRPAAAYHRHICYALYPVHEWPLSDTVRENFTWVVPTDVRPGTYTACLRVLEGTRKELRSSMPDDAEVRRRGGIIRLGKVDVTASGE